MGVAQWVVLFVAAMAITASAPRAFAQESPAPPAFPPAPVADVPSIDATNLPISGLTAPDPSALDDLDAVCDDTPAQDPAQAQSQNPPQPQQQTAPPAAQCSGKKQKPAATQPGQQPKRILGVMPNFRAVSAGTRPPPPTPKQSFKIATENSFDYSSFIFVGITSMLAEGTDAHPDLGKGVPGFGRYYWRGFVDKTDGNYLVIFAFPSVFHQDERFYAKGSGNFFKRGIYAASRILITPDYHGHNSFNASELLGRAVAQGISISYYPSHDRTLGALSTKYAYALGRDALTNTFREFWPDIAQHVLHRHP
ncbi:MAG TPA: hypothetical protein VMH00_01350 [Candidatus Limnocylindrales bacterium]|nr:hypothetical protein [Candidatus Limnocylindrales bacterium]